VIRLPLMKEWFDRVDDGRRSPIADLIAAPWFDADASVRCGPVSSNIVCRVTAGGRTYYLRLNHHSERTAEYYGGEMAFVEHLAASGVAAARPVRSKAGALVESVLTEMGTFHAVLLEEAPGSLKELADMDGRSLHAWGRAMAGLHTAAAGYEGRGRPGWRDHLAFAKGMIPATEAAAHVELAVVAEALSALRSDQSCFGLIHFDMEADNMRWQDGTPQVFDFDDCAHYWFAADIAFALRDLYDDRIERIDPIDLRLRTFVEGYRSVRPLSEDELRLLPLFMRAHNLYWFARLHRAVADGAIPGEDQWTTALRAKLVGSMDTYREGFERHPLGTYLG
jgi:Ser/Thr protein kinase RdoA (MazF antagonist)